MKYNQPIKHIYLLYMYKHYGLMSRVSADGSRDRTSIPGQVIPKIKKIVLYAALLNT